jgi:hypothetical protein
MARYKPSKPFDTPLLLYVVTGTENKLGKTVKTYAKKGVLFFGSFATFGGTERDINGVYSVEDTAQVETWYRPEFASSARVALANAPDRLYEIIGEPEDIEQRHQFCKFKLTRAKGGA